MAESTNPLRGFGLYLSRIILFVAYLVSVAFYIKLLSAFFVHGLGISREGIPWLERVFSTVLLLIIGVRGYLKGLFGLERFEEIAVNGKLAIIAGLLVGLIGYNGGLIWSGTWILGLEQTQPSWNSLRVLMGSLVVVQGFETSRFLQGTYSAEKCIETMGYAQVISGLIYMVFISLMMVVSQGLVVASDTAVIDLSAKVSSLLPAFLLIAAGLSQFSAAIADTIGAGGLLSGLQNKFSLRSTYLLIIIVALTLVWVTNVFQIISIASRCFSAYYASECFFSARRNLEVSKFRALLQSGLVILLLLCAIYGVPAEN